MKGTKYLFLAATALSFAACSSDDENMGANDGPVAAQITAGINDVLTRAFGQSWEANDAIGVSVYTPTDGTPTLTQYTNMHYVTTAGDGNALWRLVIRHLLPRCGRNGIFPRLLSF